MNQDLSTKIKKILKAIDPVTPGSILHVNVQHEDGCPAIKSERLTDCTCKDPVIEKREA
jgi:hypothetical protein